MATIDGDAGTERPPVERLVPPADSDPCPSPPRAVGDECATGPDGARLPRTRAPRTGAPGRRLLVAATGATGGAGAGLAIAAAAGGTVGDPLRFAVLAAASALLLAIALREARRDARPPAGRADDAPSAARTVPAGAGEGIARSDGGSDRPADPPAAEERSAFAVTDARGAPVVASPAFATLAARLGRPRAAGPFDLPLPESARRHLYLLARRAVGGRRVAGGAAPGSSAGGAADAPLVALVRPDGAAAPIAVSVSRLDGPSGGGDHLLWFATPAAAGAPAADPGADPARLFAEALVAASPGAVAAVEPSGRILAASDDFRRLVRRPGPATRADPVTIDDVLGGEDGRPASAALAPAFSGARERLDLDLPAREDPARLWRLSARPLGPAGDGPLAVVALADVTRQSALEARFAQGQKLQAIGQLAGGVAHDFNNVLTAIIGFSDLLLQSHRPSDPSFRDIMNIRQSAQRAAGLVRQLLAFSRRQTLRPTSLDLNDVLGELTVMLDRLLGERVSLRIEYGRDLWRVMADVSQLEQVVINLAVNARDAMPGGGTVTIRTRNLSASEVAARDVEGALAGEAVAIEIADNGSGIPPEILDKIFEPFFTTKEIGEGTGLGLSTVYGIVKQTGGSLLVDTVAGEGTTFTVLLPRSRPETEAAEAAEQPAEAAHRGDAAAPAARRQDLTGSATLLLVEDEEAIRMFAARALSNKGYRVLTAANGLDALDVLAGEGGAVDLLVSDVIMPEMDGPALVAEVERLYPDMRIMLMSGYADAAQAGALEARRDIRFIPKPFTLKTLAEAVKAALGD